MVVMTEGAGSLLQHIHAEQGLSNTLRLVLEQGEPVVGTSEPASNDAVLFHNGTPVLRLSPDAATALDGCIVGTHDTPEGPALAIISDENAQDDEDDA